MVNNVNSAIRLHPKIAKILFEVRQYYDKEQSEPSHASSSSDEDAHLDCAGSVNNTNFIETLDIESEKSMSNSEDV